MKSVIELAKESGFGNLVSMPWIKGLERFAALVQADLMKQVMSICEAEYNAYDKMVEEDDSGHEECCALIHLMRKLDKLRPATGKEERQWADLTDEEMLESMITYYGGGLSTVTSRDLKVARRVIAAFKEKNK